MPGKIKGKARAKTVRNKWTGKVHSFTPEDTISYEDLIRWCYREAGGKYFKDWVCIDIKCYYSIPKSYSKKQRLKCLEKEIMPCKKPDWDNVGKIVCDALNRIAYKDDAYVVDGRVGKDWSCGDEYMVVEINGKY